MYTAPDSPELQGIEVTGTAIHDTHDLSHAVDVVNLQELAEQNLTLVRDALRNVAGVTLNPGEGGAHGDSVILRGLSIPDSFFMDGVRDIAWPEPEMFLHIPQVLKEDQPITMRSSLGSDSAPWGDGRATAGHQGSSVKHNEQLDETSPLAHELGNLMIAQLERHP